MVLLKACIIDFFIPHQLAAGNKNNEDSLGNPQVFLRETSFGCRRGAFLGSKVVLDSESGFTLIEMMVVMSLLAIMFSLCLMMGMDGLRGGTFNDDRDMAVSCLQRARSLAVNNICFGSGCTDGRPHGVHFDPSEKRMVIFQGLSFHDNPENAEADENIEFSNKDVSIIATSSFDIVFDNLSGNLSPESAASGTLILGDGAGHTSIIEVNSQGRIDWR